MHFFVHCTNRFFKSCAIVEPNISLYVWLNMQLTEYVYETAQVHLVWHDHEKWFHILFICILLNNIYDLMSHNSNKSWYIGLHMYPNIKLQCFYYHFMLQAAVWWYCWFLFLWVFSVLETWTFQIQYDSKKGFF